VGSNLEFESYFDIKKNRAISFNALDNYLLLYRACSPNGSGACVYNYQMVEADQSYDDFSETCKTGDRVFSHIDVVENKCVYKLACDSCVSSSMCKDKWSSMGLDIRENSNASAWGYEPIENCS